MLESTNIIVFCESNHLFPGCDTTITDLQSYLKIIFRAQRLGDDFGAFIREAALLDYAHNEWIFPFDTWEQVISDYHCFILGRSKQKAAKC